MRFGRRRKGLIAITRLRSIFIFCTLDELVKNGVSFKKVGYLIKRQPTFYTFPTENLYLTTSLQIACRKLGIVQDIFGHTQGGLIRKFCGAYTKKSSLHAPILLKYPFFRENFPYRNKLYSSAPYLHENGGIRDAFFCIWKWRARKTGNGVPGKPEMVSQENRKWRPGKTRNGTPRKTGTIQENTWCLKND